MEVKTKEKMVLIKKKLVGKKSITGALRMLLNRLYECKITIIKNLIIKNN
jgi:hypothetical protein